jgi:hypothetical protein
MKEKRKNQFAESSGLFSLISNPGNDIFDQGFLSDSVSS